LLLDRKRVERQVLDVRWTVRLPLLAEFTPFEDLQRHCSG